MPLQVGSQIAHYTVDTLIGEGGMGQVYQATDTKLNRQVALKILPEAFAADPDRLARFEREAKVLASLNHPGIAGIHGLEEQDGTKALVLELVEGPTLADRIAEGPIPVDEALPIAKQIAEALEAAHEQGIIHRDLKPANIKLRPDGTVKVLDFGLAKALDTTPEGDPNQSPTLTAAATQMGVIMGTAAYMSPEQARGKPVDKRADIWAFGCVLYEMLTGRRPFQGDDVSVTLASVIKSEADIQLLPKDLPGSVTTAILNCLRKDPLRRIRDVGDLQLALEGEFETATPATNVTGQSLAKRSWPPAAAALLTAVLSFLIAISVWPSGAPVQQAVARFSIPLVSNQSFTGLGRHAVSVAPDGSRIAFTADDALWMRTLDQLRAVPLPGTERAREPFFSADGQWLGFWADGQLKKIPAVGGVPVPIGEAPPLLGVHWASDDTILFGQPDGVWRVAGAGGVPEQILEVTAGERVHGPQMLPGEDWVLFTVLTPLSVDWDTAQIVAQSLSTGERVVLVATGRDARYLSSGHLVYALGGVLFAVRFDGARREVLSGPVPVLEGVDDAGVVSGAAQFSLSRTGSLAYIPGLGGPAGLGMSELVWVDHDGKAESLGSGVFRHGSPRVSKDGSRVAVTRGDQNVWVYDIGRRVWEPVTSTPGIETNLAWMNDGLRLAFYSSDGDGGIFTQRVDGVGQADRLTSGNHRPYAWTSGDDQLSFIDMVGTDGSLDVAFVEYPSGSRSSASVASSAMEANPALSPDDRWLAYMTDETGQAEVFVRPFPEVEGGRTRISVAGGGDPIWHPDGTHLYYRDDQAIMAVALTDGPPSEWDTPIRVFEGDYLFAAVRAFDISPDGTRFLMLKRPETEAADPLDRIVFVQNWHTELLERVPVD